MFDKLKALFTTGKQVTLADEQESLEIANMAKTITFMFRDKLRESILLDLTKFMQDVIDASPIKGPWGFDGSWTLSLNANKTIKTTYLITANTEMGAAIVEFGFPDTNKMATVHYLIKNNDIDMVAVDWKELSSITVLNMLSDYMKNKNVKTALEAYPYLNISGIPIEDDDITTLNKNNNIVTLRPVN